MMLMVFLAWFCVIGADFAFENDAVSKFGCLFYKEQENLVK